jgi:5-methylcytosine-specific restriction enzyme subunit McrC
VTSGPLRLVENGRPCEVVLDDAVGTALAAGGFVDARPVPGTPLWQLTPQSVVGAIRVGGVQIQVAPKIPIERVVFLLEYTQAGVKWRDDLVDVQEAADLLTAVIETFERITSRALRQGLIQGYRTVDDQLAVVRGRIREADQLRRQFGLPVPVELRYDDFTPDTAENRLLRAAILSARRLPGLGVQLRHRLARLDLQLADVTAVTERRQLEPWRPSRLNSRLHHALHLARVIVDGASFEPVGVGLTVTGFTVNMAKVFEDFVCAVLGRRLRQLGGTTQTQHTCHLDHDGQVRMKPDLVWFRDDGSVVAVIDAKYKAEKPTGFPDADLYQMLAYCTALGLPTGHLVYAKGNELSREHRVRGADIVLRAHSLDLAHPPEHLLAELSSLGDAIAETAGLADWCVGDGVRRLGKAGARRQS